MLSALDRNARSREYADAFFWLAEWHAKSGLSLRRFINTSGQLYRQHNVKARLDAGMSDTEAYDLLATNGMLVKRPIVVGSVFVLTGFIKEADWEAALL